MTTKPSLHLAIADIESLRQEPIVKLADRVYELTYLRRIVSIVIHDGAHQQCDGNILRTNSGLSCRWLRMIPSLATTAPPTLCGVGLHQGG